MWMQEGASLGLALHGPGDKASRPNTESDAFLSHFTTGSAFAPHTDAPRSPTRRTPAPQGAPAGVRASEACF